MVGEFGDEVLGYVFGCICELICLGFFCDFGMECIFLFGVVVMMDLLLEFVYVDLLCNFMFLFVFVVFICCTCECGCIGGE